METNKYYTPDLSEFCIGFEYEVSGNDGDGWNTEIIKDKHELIQALEDDLLYISRVKYLDKSDIESIGWRYWKTHPGTTTMEFETNDGRYNITFNPEWDNDWNCTIQDEVEFTYFHGFIKNKSELIKLLKMLNINA